MASYETVVGKIAIFSFTWALCPTWREIRSRRLLMTNRKAMTHTLARWQIGTPCTVSKAFDGTRSGVVKQHVADVTPERQCRVVGVVISVDGLIGQVRHRRT